jgi:hypothetical protein
MTMKPIFFLLIIILIGCGNSDVNKKDPGNAAETNVENAAMQSEQTGIIGEWEQQYTSFDKNGNNQLDADEKKASGTRLGFNWFKFNADGTCLRDKDIQFKGTYEVQEKNGTKKLVIQGGDKLSYTIVELTSRELILGADGAFMIFKKLQ